MKQRQRQIVWAFAKLVIVVGLLTILGMLALRYNYELSAVKEYLASFRLLPAIFLYIALYAFVSIAPIPGARDAFKLAGPLRFGFLGSVVLVWAGEMLAAVISLPLSRWGGKDLLDRLFGNRLEPFNRRIEGADWKAIAFLRILPVVPYRHFNFAAGLVELRFMPYLIGSAIGILLRTAFFQFLFTYMMDYLVRAGTTTAQLYMFSLILVPVMLVLFWLFSRRKKSKQQTNEKAEP